jgi:hypothetical protein
VNTLFPHRAFFTSKFKFISPGNFDYLASLKMKKRGLLSIVFMVTFTLFDPHVCSRGSGQGSHAAHLEMLWADKGGSDLILRRFEF